MKTELCSLLESIVCRIEAKTLKFINLPYELMLSLNYSAEEINSLTFGDLCDYENLIQITNADEQITYNLQVGLKHKKGHWLSFHVKFFKTSDNYYVNFTELTLPENNRADFYTQTYQQIIEQGEMLILIYRFDGKILFVSENSDSIWGYKPSEVINTHAQSYYDENQLVVAQHVTMEALETHQGVPFKIRVVHRRGYKIWLEGVTKIFANESFQLEGQEAFLCIARDVTHKMNTEQALYQSQNILDAVFENSTEPILLTDAELTILGFNKSATQAATDFMGVQIFTGAPLGTYLEYFKFRIEDLIYIIQSKTLKTVETKIKNVITNEFHWFKLSINPVFQEEKFIGLFLTGVDFTAAQKSQEDLAISEKRFRDLIFNAPDVIAVLNKNGHVEMVSNVDEQEAQTLDQILGLKRDDVSDFLQSDIQEFRTENEYHVQNEAKLLDLIYKKTAGETLIFGRDITDKNKIQVELERADKQYQNIFANSPVGLAVLSNKGILLSVNPAFCQMLQYSKQEIIRDSILEMIFSEDIQEFNNSVLQTSKQDKDRLDVRVELRFMQKNGNIISTILRAIPYKVEPDKILIQIIDISYRVKAEQKILENLHEKEVLLKEIHHRVKNNLQIISSLLFLQSNQYENDGVKDFYQKSQSRIMSIAMLHEQLYRSDELSKIPMKPYIENLITFIRTTLDGNSSIQITSYADDDLSLSVEKAPPMGLIINELVTNALKHAFPNKDGLLEITLSKKAKKILLKVEDNGKGLPDDFQEKKKSSIGFELIEMLVGQIDGKMLFGNKPDLGCFFEIYFTE